MRAYPVFYRSHGVRMLGHLSQPPLSPVADLLLPKESIVHYIAYDDIENGPPIDDVMYQNHRGRLMVSHVSDLKDPVGRLRPNAAMKPSRLKMEYHRRYRRMRPIHNLEQTLRDERTLITFNYAQLNHAYIYNRSIYSQYHKWKNIFNTLFWNLNKACEDTTRHQFIHCQLPRRLPTIKMLRMSIKSEQEMPRKLLDIFSKPRYMFLSILWRWLGKDRENSLLSKLDPEHYDRVNLVWSESGQWFVVNLQRLLDIIGEDDEEDEGSMKLQRRFMAMLMSLIEVRSSSEPPSTDEETEIQEEPSKKDHDLVVEKDHEIEDHVRDELEDPEPESAPTDDELKEELDVWDEVNDEMDVEEQEELDAILEAPVDALDKVQERINTLAEDGQLSAAEYRRYNRLLEKSKTIKNPFGEGTLEEFRKVDPKDTKLTEPEVKIPKRKGVIEPSQLESSLIALDRKYITEVMQKDVVNMAMSVQEAGVIVTDMKAEVIEDAMNKYQVVSMRITPVDGEPTTIRFRLPVVDEHGNYVANGVKYRMRKQRADMPIRKVSPSTVALTSYYAKLFVDRSEKAVVNYPRWLINNIVSIGMDPEDGRVSGLKYASVFDHRLKLPRTYSILATRFKTLTVSGDVTLYLDYHKRKEKFGEEKVAKLEEGGFVVIGSKDKDLIVIDENSVLYQSTRGKLQVLGSIEDLIELDTTKAPVEIAEFRLFSKNVPVVMALGYRFGLGKLMKLLDVKPRRVTAGAQMNLESSEYAIRFADETLIFNRDNSKAQLIIAGLNRYHRDIKRYTSDAFNDPEVFVNILEDNNIRIGFIRELDLAFDMFVDPITKEILDEMKEPDRLDLLLIRACELLLTDWHPAETDMSAMRERGYERMSGAVYTEMVRSVRKYRSRGAGKDAKIEMNPEAVWQAIAQDPSTAPVEELNPIHNLKEKEVITYMGTGGRSTQSMVKRTRQYHGSEVGVISEATVDSSSVGVNASLSANPRINNVRGIATPPTDGELQPSNMVSTAAMLAPAIHYDDPKRANFVSIQHTHGVATVGNDVTPLRTGYERIIAHRTDDLFAVTAKQDGVVSKVDDKHITIRYKDGSEVSVEIGRRYGNVSDSTIPHSVVTKLKPGDKFKVGDIVAYNEGYFKPDPLDKTQVLWKSGVMAKVAIMENPHTFEDASAISERMAEKLGTATTSVRMVTVNFDHSIRDLVKVGSKVDAESILCMIEDSVTASNDLFDEASLDLLKTMSSNAPTAKYAGVIEKIEVFYHGDIEDMTDSLREIAVRSDKERTSKLRALGKKPTTGRVDGSVRIDRDPLDLDSAIIKIYITKTVGAGIGDKGVFGNQLKTIFSHVLTGINRTESGVDIDALFSYLSISNRITLSPEMLGTANSLLMTMSKQVADKYFSLKRGK